MKAHSLKRMAPALALVGGLLAWQVGCSDGPTGAGPVGGLEVTTSVTNNFDPDGFGVRVGGTGVGTVGVDTSAAFSGLAAGVQSLELTGIAANCAVDGQNPRDVTIVAGQTTSDTFNITCTSPPGGRILFYGAGADVWVTNADGSGVTNLTNDDTVRDLQPAWSPDGEKIAFASDREGGDYDIYVMNKDASDLVRLTVHQGSDLEPAWSPDGTRLAFVSDRDRSDEVFLINADGTGLTQLTADVGSTTDAVGPTWSPDGARIAFIGARPTGAAVGDETIYSIAIDGTDLRRLTGPAPICAQTGGAEWIDWAPDWSPDGTRIVFLRVYDCGTDDRRLMVMNSDGANPLDITPAGVPRLGWPSWSPDGTQIVLGGGCAGCGDGMWVINADGTGAVHLLAGNDSVNEPDWGAH